VEEGLLVGSGEWTIVEEFLIGRRMRVDGL
jgi:hypothetical protein